MAFYKQDSEGIDVISFYTSGQCGKTGLDRTLPKGLAAGLPMHGSLGCVDVVGGEWGIVSWPKMTTLTYGYWHTVHK